MTLESVKVVMYKGKWETTAIVKDKVMVVELMKMKWDGVDVGVMPSAVAWEDADEINQNFRLQQVLVTEPVEHDDAHDGINKW